MRLGLAISLARHIAVDIGAGGSGAFSPLAGTGSASEIFSGAGSGAFSPLTGTGVASEFSPIDLGAGLIMWVRGDTVSLTSGKVSTWNDKGPVGNSPTQGVANNRPTQNTSDAGYNGQATLSFSSSLGFMAVTLASQLVQPATVYIVGESSTNTADYRTFLDGIGVTNRWLIVGDVTTGRINMQAGAQLLSLATGGTKHVIACVFNGASSAIYVDSLTAAASGNAGTKAIDGFTLGSLQGGASGGFLNGKIAEIVAATGAHDATTRQSMMQYLAREYAITLS